MKFVIDTDKNVLEKIENGEKTASLPLYSKACFEAVSDLWLKVGWSQNYSYSFTWLGIPIIQLPEDVLRVQEVIYAIRPDVIVETGVAHGGSLVLYASLCHLMNKGRVIGVDVKIRSENRQALENHELSRLITLIENDSVAPETVDRVAGLIKPDETVIILLDSCHTKEHVLAELAAYSNLVSVGSYIVATDGVMKDLADVPEKGNPDWLWDNPTAAALEFVAGNDNFILERPDWLFNESDLTENITHWPQAWLKRIR